MQPQLITPSVLLSQLLDRYLTPGFLAMSAFVVVIGLALIALYFIESQFQVAVNLIIYGTPDRTGQLARRDGRPGAWRSGWYKDDAGQWRKFNADGEEAWAMRAEYRARQRAFYRGYRQGSYKASRSYWDE